MRTSRSLLAGITLTAASMTGQTSEAASVSGHRWNVEADEHRETITVRYEGLGILLDDVHLFVVEAGARRPLHGWRVEREKSDQLTIHTAERRSFWRISLSEDLLAISTTEDNALLTATASSSIDRQPVRLLDPDGVPVRWTGNSEVHDGYGGDDTVQQSFLPRRNADVMTFSLGLTSASNLHSLFDQHSDTAIDFPEQTTLERPSSGSGQLSVTLPVQGNAVVRLRPNYFTTTLGLPYYVPFDDSHFPRPPVVWSSWTSYYSDVTERDIVRNADWLAKNLKAYGFDYVQLDDGYDRDKKGQHFWISNWDEKKFPHGPRWLAQYIKSVGLGAGIWLVPNAYAGAINDHPDWYLHDKHGKFILDYDTPTLDSSNPEVLGFLKHLFTTLDDWGFDYYKFDGEHAAPLYIPKIDRAGLYDTTSQPLETYRKRLETIREVIGPNRFIEGCPAGTPLNGIGYFQSYFNGQDLYNTWQGMYPLFSSINANAFLNHRVVYVMPGEGVELNPPMRLDEVRAKRHPSVLNTADDREHPLTGFGTTSAEAHTLLAYLSLTGVVYPLASVMPELPEERVDMLKKTLPPQPIFPVDLYSRGTDMQYDQFRYTTAEDYVHNYPEILDLKVNAASGVYDVAGVTNWHGDARVKKVSFQEALGLSSAPYAVFDFWNQKFLGVFQEGVEIEVPPHDTRVLLIHPALPHPQLMGIERHITGSYSIEKQAWEPERERLSGRSTTIAGTPYSLWIRVPSGFKVSSVKASSSGHDVPAKSTVHGELETLSFEGQSSPVDWEVAFSSEAQGRR